MNASCAKPTSDRSRTSGSTDASAASAARSRRNPVTNKPRVYQKKYSAAASRCASAAAPRDKNQPRAAS